MPPPERGMLEDRLQCVRCGAASAGRSPTGRGRGRSSPWRRPTQSVLPPVRGSVDAAWGVTATVVVVVGTDSALTVVVVVGGGPAADRARNGFGFFTEQLNVAVIGVPKRSSVAFTSAAVWVKITGSVLPVGCQVVSGNGSVTVSGWATPFFRWTTAVGADGRVGVRLLGVVFEPAYRSR